jgi:hypothetical protein
MNRHYQIIAGGRDFTDVEWMEQHVELFAHRSGLLGLTPVIVQGEARGADTLAKRAGLARNIEVLSYPADWDRHGRRAGWVRNQEMAQCLLARQSNGHTVSVVLFPGGVGTRMMRDIAREWEIPCYEPRPFQVVVD